ncbi:MAG TPA: dihydrodipicolinate synthase family protein [Steroidobacteraceae bacterium]|nr:dihydrodipicolinate synthase family protein [Steroidobacteraceae bacterium]
MSRQTFWRGVLPALTTPFDADGGVDHGFLAEHAKTMIAAGCAGLVPLGSLGEGNVLSFEEKLAVLRTLVAVLPQRPVIAGIAALSTAEAVRLAQAAERAGCRGLMVLPPYVYVGSPDEMQAHVSAVIEATKLPCMLYNNPVAYRTDFLPEHIAELAARHANLEAVKESSTDVRRVTAIRALIGDRLDVLVGVDDAIVEGVAAGAVGWVAGLVNAFPRESVRLFESASAGRDAQTDALYRWFLPLLRLDTVPKFVQLIKLAQQQVGMGGERVRAPRAVLCGAERESALALIEHARRNKPEL